MAAPRTANATRSNVRRGDETAAARLHAHGWFVLSPEEVAALSPDAIDDLIRALPVDVLSRQLDVLRAGNGLSHG